MDTASHRSQDRVVEPLQIVLFPKALRIARIGAGQELTLGAEVDAEQVQRAHRQRGSAARHPEDANGPSQI